MKIILYVAILISVFLIPVERLDVAKLEPVEAVAVYMNRGNIVLETDTEALGQGKTVEEALENLKMNTPAVIYLDTAEYVLVADNAEEHGVQLQKYLKDNIKAGRYAGGSVKEEAKYLDAHEASAKPQN